MSQQPANREKAAMSTAWLLNNAKTNSPNHILASCGWHFLARQLPYPGRLQSRNWPPNAPESSYMSLLSISKDKPLMNTKIFGKGCRLAQNLAVNVAYPCIYKGCMQSILFTRLVGIKQENRSCAKQVQNIIVLYTQYLLCLQKRKIAADRVQKLSSIQST